MYKYRPAGLVHISENTIVLFFIPAILLFSYIKVYNMVLDNKIKDK